MIHNPLCTLFASKLFHPLCNALWTKRTFTQGRPKEPLFGTTRRKILGGFLGPPPRQFFPVSLTV